MYTFVYIKLKLIEGVKKVAFGENLQLHFLLSGILALIWYTKKRLFVYFVRIDSDIEKLLVSMMSPL